MEHVPVSLLTGPGGCVVPESEARDMETGRRRGLACQSPRAMEHVCPQMGRRVTYFAGRTARSYLRLASSLPSDRHGGLSIGSDRRRIVERNADGYWGMREVGNWRVRLKVALVWPLRDDHSSVRCPHGRVRRAGSLDRGLLLPPTRSVGSFPDEEVAGFGQPVVTRRQMTDSQS